MARKREDVEESMSKFIAMALLTGKPIGRITITKSDSLLLGKLDPITKTRSIPKVFKGVMIRVA